MVKKTDYNTKITDIKNRIPSVTGLLTTAAFNANTEIESKIFNINNLATKVALNTKAAEIESKIPSVTSVAT